MSAGSNALPRLRTLCTNSKKPRYRGSFSCAMPRCGRCQLRNSDQKPSIVFTWTSHQPSPSSSRAKRCFRAVDSMSDGSPKLIVIDEQPNHQVVHMLCLRKANRPAYQPLDPGAQVDVFALDLLRVCLPHRV